MSRHPSELTLWKNACADEIIFRREFQARTEKLELALRAIIDQVGMNDQPAQTRLNDIYDIATAALVPDKPNEWDQI